jgi:hypothetical protein
VGPVTSSFTLIKMWKRMAREAGGGGGGPSRLLALLALQPTKSHVICKFHLNLDNLHPLNLETFFLFKQ